MHLVISFCARMVYLLWSSSSDHSNWGIIHTKIVKGDPLALAVSDKGFIYCHHYFDGGFHSMCDFRTPNSLSASTLTIQQVGYNIFASHWILRHRTAGNPIRPKDDFSICGFMAEEFRRCKSQYVSGWKGGFYRRRIRNNRTRGQVVVGRPS